MLVYSANPAAQQQQPTQQQQQQQPQAQQQQQQPTQQQRQQQENAATSDIDEKRGDVGVHGFWKRGTQAIFDVRITDTSSRSHRNTDPLIVLQRQEKEKKDKYRDACLE